MGTRGEKLQWRACVMRCARSLLNNRGLSMSPHENARANGFSDGACKIFLRARRDRSTAVGTLHRLLAADPKQFPCFDDRDKARINELSDLAQPGELTTGDQAKLDG